MSEFTDDQLIAAISAAHDNGNGTLARALMAVLNAQSPDKGAEVTRGRERQREETPARKASRKRRIRRLQSATLPSAAVRYQPWSEAEVSVLSNSDLTLHEQAELLGRTFYAVRTKRERLGLA